MTTDAQFPEPLIMNGHTGAVSFVAWSPDGSLLATATDGLSSGDVTPRLWDADGTLVAELSGDAVAVTGLSWSADSALLAVGGADGVVRLWNRDGTAAATITVSNDSPPSPISAVAWSPAGSLLATALVALPDPATPGPYNTLPANVQLWTPDDAETQSFQIEHTFRGMVRLTWSDDGTRLAAGGNDLHVWTTSGNTLLDIPGGEFDVVSAMAFAPDGATLAFANAMSQLQVHPVDGGTPSYVPGFTGVISLDFSPDNMLLAVTTESAVAVVATDNPTAPPTPIVTNGAQGAPVWSPDGTRLAIGTPRRTVAIASVDGAPTIELTGCDGTVVRLDWSPDGATLVVGLSDGRVCLWDVTS